MQKGRLEIAVLMLLAVHPVLYVKAKISKKIRRHKVEKIHTKTKLLSQE